MIMIRFDKTKLGQLRGLTLLELLVVVAILAILATVAIRSTADFGQQARYDATQITLRTFRDGVLGPANQMTPTGIPLVTGFIADMGRPPRSYLDSTATAYDVPELYAISSTALPSSAIFPFKFYQNTSANVQVTQITSIPVYTAQSSLSTTTFTVLADSTLTIPAGWRGPYITKPMGFNYVTDGWGKPLVTRYSDVAGGIGTLSLWPTMLLTTYSSTLGSTISGQAYSPVTAANLDVLGWYTVSGFTDAYANPGDPYSGNWYSGISSGEYSVGVQVGITVANSLTMVSGTSLIQLAVYGPDPNMVTHAKPVQCSVVEVRYTSAMGNPINLQLSGTNAPTIGPRVFRAWVNTSGNAGAANWKAGAPLYFPMRSGISLVNVTVP